MRIYTGCIKIIGAVSICHYGFENARRSKFATWNETAGVQFCAQQDGAPLHFRLDVRRWLNDVLPHRWIVRGAHEDLIFCPWPARSPDLTLRDYFLSGYVKDKCLCHHYRRAYLI